MSVSSSTGPFIRPNRQTPVFTRVNRDVIRDNTRVLRKVRIPERSNISVRQMYSNIVGAGVGIETIGIVNMPFAGTMRVVTTESELDFNNPLTVIEITNPYITATCIVQIERVVDGTITTEQLQSLITLGNGIITITGSAATGIISTNGYFELYVDTGYSGFD